MNEIELISLINDYFEKHNKVPTIVAFSKEYNLQTTYIVRQFGKWNTLLNKANLKPNKSSKRTDEQLLLWMKAHPNYKYYDIPSGIRSSLEQRFGSIGKARELAGLNIIDWRSLPKKKQKNQNKKHSSSCSGRPIEYSKEFIINGLKDLAILLGRPPRMKDITKKTCGFPISAIISRFGTFNIALQEATLPPVYSYHEHSKLEIELETILLNIKICMNDIPKYFKLNTGDYTDLDLATFEYDDRLEYVKISRNDAINNKISVKNKKIIIYYLIDDILEDAPNNIELIYVHSLINKLDNNDNNKKIILKKINELQSRYDDVNRTYVWEKKNISTKLNNENIS